MTKSTGRKIHPELRVISTNTMERQSYGTPIQHTAQVLSDALAGLKVSSAPEVDEPDLLGAEFDEPTPDPSYNTLSSNESDALDITPNASGPQTFENDAPMMQAKMGNAVGPRRGTTKDVENPMLFEIAWEVANKVGGIYTVLKSKAAVTVEEFGERYLLMGPLAPLTADAEVEELEPESEQLCETINSMRDRGVHIVYGRWLIDGAPRVILFDINSVLYRVDEWRGDLYNVAGIPCPPNDMETNDAIAFGYCVAWFLGEYIHNHPSTAIIAHFHEWLVGVGLTLVRKRCMDVATIFTTHATLLGRYLCAGSVDFYNNLRNFDVDYEAGRRGIYHRYCIERAAAHSANVFTTVSHITAYEAEHLLKRRPDSVLENGLNVIKFSATQEFQNLHALNKEKINDFVRGHFYGHYDFDLNNTLYFFTAAGTSTEQGRRHVY